MVGDGGVNRVGGSAECRSVVVLEREVAVVAGVRNAADARLVELVAEALAGGQWLGSGIYTPVQWVMLRAGVSRVAAQRIVALARRAPELPETMRRFCEGRISVDQASVVARFVPAEFEASVAEMAESATVPQLVRSTREYDFDTDAPERDDGPEATPAEPVPEAPGRGVERSVAFGTDDGGQWWAQVKLPVDEGMEVEAALRAERDRLLEAGRKAAADKTTAAAGDASDDGEAGTASGVGADGGPTGRAGRLPSWADAFMEMVRSAIAHSGQGTLGRVRAQVLVHLERPSAGEQAWRASTTLGSTLPDSLRRLMTCDADARIVGWAAGAPVDVGRSQRTVPDRVRRIVEHRDQGCRVPGCDGGMWLDVHHIIHWEDGGPTDTWNLVCLCPRHHRLHHRGQLGITGDANTPGGLRVTDRHGHELSGASRARPPTPTDIPDVAPCPGPTGERLDPTAIHFTRRHNAPAA